MKATVVNTVENTTRVIDNLPSEVTDLQALKHYLNIEDGQFYEGTSRTDLTSNNQSLPQLPESKQDKGYVFFVSPTQNKIKNGAYSRKECYAYIKANNLGEAVKQQFGRNFTQVATNVLNDFIANNGTAAVTIETVPVEDADAGKITTEKDLWLHLANMLKAEDSEENTDLNKLIEGINKVFHNPYSVQDISNMRK